MAQYAAVKGWTSLFHALEQSRSQVAVRMHALLSSTIGEQLFRATALTQGSGFNVKEYKAFLRHLKRNIPGKVHVVDASRGTVSVMGIASQIEKHRPDLVFIDYLTLLKKSGTDWQGVAQLSSDLKSLATSYLIPVVAAAQLNRADGVGKGEPPGPEALAQSDAIGQDADEVITMRQISPSVIQMRMAKNRNGPGNFRWWMEFRPGDGIIREITYQQAQDLRDKDDDAKDAEEE
jgi:replicative DNA helicase